MMLHSSLMGSFEESRLLTCLTSVTESAVASPYRQWSNCQWGVTFLLCHMAVECGIVHMCMWMLTLCKGEVACATLPRMRHQQSMPNLSRSSKLSLATTSTPTRSSAQQSARGALYTRRASAGQPLAAASLSRVKQPAPSQRTTSRTITPRQQPSSLRDFKTHAAREQSPSSSTALLAKTNDTTPRQPSRLVASSR